MKEREAMLSHEFKTPISSIQGNVDNLETYYMEGNLDKLDIIQALSAIKKSVARLSHLSEDIIDLMRANDKYIEKKSFVISERFKSLCCASEEILNYKNVRISFTSSPEKIDFYSNINMMEKLLLNLISNSVKYNTSETIKIDVSLKAKNSVLTLKVSDNGIGIPPEERKRIFNKYYRTDGSYARMAEGMGLGLFFVKQIVDAHGGDINIKSGEKGTTFTITLPLVNESNMEESTYQSVNLEKVNIALSDIQ